MLGTY
ncbi:hypothetical protein D039_5179A, partial [Vibrio parahaemolyticus EKP-028]